MMKVLRLVRTPPLTFWALARSGALQPDATESSAAATAAPGRGDASANVQKPALAAAWFKWKHLAALRRSVALKVAAFQDQRAGHYTIVCLLGLY